MVSVQLENLTRQYGPKTVFNDLNIRFEHVVCGIRGANGSGKSTLLKCMAGLLHPTKGQVIWFLSGKELSDEDFRLQSGVAAPYISLYPQLSVAENINFIRNLRAKSSLKQANELHVNLSLPTIWEKKYSDLSTGQQQRARLAASVAHDPSILLLDEPSSNLDEAGHELVHQMIKARQQAGLFTIIASNDPREWAWCEYMLNLDELGT